MRIALVFPPSLPPTFPPCGIAYLKAFLHSGKCFDANLNYYETALNMLCENALPVEADLQGYVLEPEHLKEAVTFFREDLYNLEEYNRHASIFLSFTNKIDLYIRDEFMKYVFENSGSDEAMTLLDRLVSPIRDYRPDVAGFSQLVFSQREFILAMAKRLKSEDIPILVGGASLSQSAECYLSQIGGIDLSCIFDAAFYGEGEIPLKAYTEGEPIENIPNVVYKRERITRNNETGVDELDVLPCPDFSDFPLGRYYAPEIVLSLLTSRGCYWMRCTFCIHHKSYYRYRARSPEKVVSDIRELQKKYNAHYFQFADEMIHPRTFNQLSEEILKQGLDIRFYSSVKPTRDFTSDLLAKMYDAGARVLMWGVESGTQRILDLIDKGTTVPDIEKVLKDSSRAGIWNMVFMIMGYPTQTEQEVEGDMRFLERNQQYIGTAAKSLFQLEVGSRIYENPEKYGITRTVQSPDPFSVVCRYEVSEGLSRREIRAVYGKHDQTFSKIEKGSQYFGRLRDHMLLFADRMSKNPCVY